MLQTVKITRPADRHATVVREFAETVEVSVAAGELHEVLRDALAKASRLSSLVRGRYVIEVSEPYD